MTDGPSGQRVAVHLLDVRYHKDPYSMREAGDFLGEEQWNWLNESLHRTRNEAAVNLVVSGIQVLRPWPHVGEVWGRFPQARDRLLRTLLASGARGLILLSGDAHMGQLNALRCGKTVLYELTSSGLTHSVDDWPYLPRGLGKIVSGWLLWLFPEHHLVGKSWLGRNFGELEINFGDNASMPSVLGRLFSLNPDASRGQQVLEQELLGAEAAVEGSLNSAECKPIRGEETPVAMVARIHLVVLTLGALSAPLISGLCMLCWGGGADQGQEDHEKED